MFVSFEIKETSFSFIDKNAVQYVIQQADWHSHDGEVQVVVMAAKMFQQGDSTDVEKVCECCDGKEAENQFVVLVLEHQDAISLEVEEDADNSGDEVGNDVGVVEFEEVFEDKEKDIVDEQAKGRVQHGYQHKPDELGFKIPFKKCLYHVLTLRRQK